VAGLQPKDYASGIALNNMIRQLGGAFGIAMANNYVSHQHAQHWTDLTSNLTNSNAAFMARISSATPADAAYASIAAAVDRQAYYLAYLDTFRLIAIFFIAVIPLVAFLRTKKKSPEEEKAAKLAVAEAH
jgi:DHA2 family multidrug resistance protein